MTEINFAFEAVTEGAIADCGYDGHLGDVVEQCAIVAERGVEGDTFWYPARLARAAIDATMDHEDRLQFILNVTAFALKAYAGHDAQKEFKAASEPLLSAIGASYSIQQSVDLITAASTRSDLSRKVAETIAKASDDPMLQLPICHGGFVSGIETYLYLGTMGRHDGDVLYPVRCSMDKKKDSIPFLSDAEVVYLTGFPDHRRVLTIEDTSSGLTLRTAQDYLTMVLGGMGSECYANIDAGDIGSRAYLSWYIGHYRHLDPQLRG